MPDVLRCLIEIPKGSRNKYEYDEALGGIKLDRFLFSSVVYPADYGFIPDTVGEDGDHLDVVVLVGQPTFPGCVIEVRAVARPAHAPTTRASNDKVICVPAEDPNWDEVEDPRRHPGPDARPRSSTSSRSTSSPRARTSRSTASRTATSPSR